MLKDPVLLNDFSLLYIRDYFKEMKKNLPVLFVNKNDYSVKDDTKSNLDDNKIIMNPNKTHKGNNCSNIPKIFQYQLNYY